MAADISSKFDTFLGTEAGNAVVPHILPWPSPESEPSIGEPLPLAAACPPILTPRAPWLPPPPMSG
ncbi:hypothetical protein GCM10022383_17210 [Microbacterium soli]|uniref:Uncharacterized protein n=1 Tax=Microbacterium soli TaxID=446075 RepID=A0ABP7N8K8_9MICO